MKTIWNGNELIFKFDNSNEVALNTEQTKEFEKWVFSKVTEYAKQGRTEV